MPTHAEKRRVRYSPEQMFDLVADVERYPDFLPWCQDLRVTSRDAAAIHSVMVIGYKIFRERFATHTFLYRPDHIQVTYTDGPFRYLTSDWKFLPAETAYCDVDFTIDFEFKSGLLQKAISTIFTDATKVMVRSFERRARQIYGRPKFGDSIPI